MKLAERIEKLRQQQQQLTEALRSAEAQAATRQRKAQTRAKIILGGVLMAMPPGEREALLPMFYGHMNERDQHFVTQCIADESPCDESSLPNIHHQD